MLYIAANFKCRNCINATFLGWLMIKLKYGDMLSVRDGLLYSPRSQNVELVSGYLVAKRPLDNLYFSKKKFFQDHLILIM